MKLRNQVWAIRIILGLTTLLLVSGVWLAGTRYGWTSVLYGFAGLIVFVLGAVALVALVTKLIRVTKGLGPWLKINLPIVGFQIVKLFLFLKRRRRNSQRFSTTSSGEGPSSKKPPRNGKKREWDRDRKPRDDDEFSDMLRGELSYRKAVMKKIYVAVAIAYALAWVWVLLTPIKLGFIPLDWRWVALISYLALSFKQVDVDKIGAINSFGFITKEVDPGLELVPLGVAKLDTETRLGIPVDVFEDDEDGVHHPDIKITTGSRAGGFFNPSNESMGVPKMIPNPEDPEGPLVEATPEEWANRYQHLPPWRPVGKGDVEAMQEMAEDLGSEAQEAIDALFNRMEITMRFWFRYKIQHPFLFFSNVNVVEGPSGSTRQMIDGVVSQAKKMCGMMTPAEIINNLNWLSVKLKRDIEFLIREGVSEWRDARRSWGIDITDFEIRDIKLPLEVEKGLEEVVKAALARQASVDKAVAIKNLGQAEGEKIRFAERGRLTGIAQGLAHAKKDLEIDGQTAVSLEVVPKAINQGDIVLGMEGLSQVIGLGKLLGMERQRKGGTQ